MNQIVTVENQILSDKRIENNLKDILKTLAISATIRTS
jgi:hypothetical protein